MSFMKVRTTAVFVTRDRLASSHRNPSLGALPLTSLLTPTRSSQDLSNKPDIIVATPGLLAHHLLEVPDFNLRYMECVVYDEAERLFEMGFAQQLRDISRSMPEGRQTLLFSATMPKMLVEFAR